MEILPVSPTNNTAIGPHETEGTDISKITRKQSKTGKHGHGKRKSTKEAKDSKPQSKKVNLQSNWSNPGQQKSTHKRTNPKCFISVLPSFKYYTNGP
ncbi:hypothetical protein Tco_1102781 [Tanacetum coccineum]